jgi:hypothetical protein
VAALLPVKSPRAEYEPQGQLLGQRRGESFFGSLKKERIKRQKRVPFCSDALA